MIPWIRYLINFFFSSALFLLLAGFTIALLAPGNADTHAAFTFYQQYIAPKVASIYEGLLWPVQWLLAQLTPFLPHALLAHFPTEKAAPALKWVVENSLLKIDAVKASTFGQQLTFAPYEALFPGWVDYRYLLAIPIWGWVEAITLNLLNRLDARLYRWHIRKRDRAFLNQANTAN